jgi:hypothetical protein
MDNDKTAVTGPAMTLEDKVDACLILLLTLATQDGFSYNLMDKSLLWIRAMDVADSLASDVSMRVAKSHPPTAREKRAALVDRLTAPRDGIRSTNYAESPQMSPADGEGASSSRSLCTPSPLDAGRS